MSRRAGIGGSPGRGTGTSACLLAVVLLAAAPAGAEPPDEVPRAEVGGGFACAPYCIGSGWSAWAAVHVSPGLAAFAEGGTQWGWQEGHGPWNSFQQACASRGAADLPRRSSRSAAP